jgi:hypothetical protein
MLSGSNRVDQMRCARKNSSQIDIQLKPILQVEVLMEGYDEKLRGGVARRRDVVVRVVGEEGGKRTCLQ